MIDFLRHLFASDFMPHAHCFLWKPGVLWLHVISDGVIAAAYFSIPLSLAILVRKRPPSAVSGIVALFAAFIFLCGLSHVMTIWTMWDPVYRLSGVVKALTAIVSVMTAIVTWPLVPKILASPTAKDMAAANEALRREADVRREAEQRFRMLLEAAPDAMVIVDDQGSIVLVNARCESLFGYAKHEIIGRPIEKLVPDRFRPAHASQRERYLSSPTSKPMGAGRELYGLRNDGSEFPVEISLSPLETPTGLLVTSAIRDISDRRQHEHRLRELNVELTRRVDDRTEELERRARELSRSNEELEEFAYVISHDLKSPMRGIASLSEWLAADHGDQLDADGRHQLELLQQRASRMHDMIEGVLEYSRAARKPDAAEQVDVGELLEEVVDVLAPPPGVEVVFSELPSVEYPRVQLMQVFQNLIGNAIRHMGSEEGSVRVSALQVLDRIEFRVADDGIGIAPEHHERIFRMFQTLSPQSAGRVGGLGLAIVKKIVERNGGLIYLESSENQGTTFVFSVPLASERPGPEATG